MSEQPLGLGLVGVGGFGVFCLAAFAEMREIKVTAVADLDVERARAAAPAGAAVYQDYEALIADPAVGVVAINTPPHLHAHMSIQAAQAGKHIFVEKPLATSFNDAQNIIKAAEQNGVQFTVDYVLRFHPLYQLAMRVVHSGAFGVMRHFSLENFATDDSLLPGHWFWDPAQSGGIHVEHGVHFIDLCNHLTPCPPESASGTIQQREDGRMDRVSALVRYDDEALASFYHSFNQIRPVEQTTIRINCERGHITLYGWIPTELTLTGLTDKAGLAALQDILGSSLEIVERFEGAAAVFPHGGRTEILAASVRAAVSAPDRQGDYKRGIQAALCGLVAAVRDSKPLEVTARDGLMSLAVALAATESAHSGRIIPVKS
ncbi:MAG: gfo/Idh/MocA family oxidoreductase [Chloroflexi bacterium]|nr:MAG: gfo/Idh/MocA family oxidoreductase [Chloroflexota bacterium]